MRERYVRVIHTLNHRSSNTQWFRISYQVPLKQLVLMPDTFFMGYMTFKNFCMNTVKSRGRKASLHATRQKILNLREWVFLKKYYFISEYECLSRIPKTVFFCLNRTKLKDGNNKLDTAQKTFHTILIFETFL